MTHHSLTPALVILLLASGCNLARKSDAGSDRAPEEAEREAPAAPTSPAPPPASPAVDVDAKEDAPAAPAAPTPDGEPGAWQAGLVHQEPTIMAERTKDGLELRMTPAVVASRLRLSQLDVHPASLDPAAAATQGTSPSGQKSRSGVSSAEPPAHEVTVYAVFDQSFEHRLQLRAFDDQQGELGRSERARPLKQSADTASYLTFRFDTRMPMAKVRAFTVYIDSDQSPPAPAAVKPGPKTTPRPEPELIRPPRTGLVPKNP